MKTKMKVCGLIIGYVTADTMKVIEANDLDLNHCLTTNRFITQEECQQMQAHLADSIPDDCDLMFFSNIDTESKIIDLPDADVYVVYSFSPGGPVLFHALASKNKPILIVQPPYQDSWSYGAVAYPYFVRDNREISQAMGLSNLVTVISSTQELKKYLAAYQVKFRMNHAVVMCLGEPMRAPYGSKAWGYAVVRAMQEKFGVKWINFSAPKVLELYDAWEGTYPKGQIEKDVAQNLVQNTDAIERVEKLYYVFKQLIEENEVTGFTVNCLASTVHTGINATACYALSKLNDDGIVAACESDISTLMAMMLVSFTSHRPVFMLNPYLFPMDNKLFVSHCSCPSRHSYEEGSLQDPLNLYNYFELGDMGCGIQAIREPGEVTIAGLSPHNLSRMVIVKGRMVRNTSFASCRTQMEIDIDGDVKALAENYQGRHWALVYGDYVEDLVRVNGLLNIESIVI